MIARTFYDVLVPGQERDSWSCARLGPKAWFLELLMNQFCKEECEWITIFRSDFRAANHLDFPLSADLRLHFYGSVSYCFLK